MKFNFSRYLFSTEVSCSSMFFDNFLAILLLCHLIFMCDCVLLPLNIATAELRTFLIQNQCSFFPKMIVVLVKLMFISFVPVLLFCFVSGSFQAAYINSMHSGPTISCVQNRMKHWSIVSPKHVFMPS